MEVDCIIEIQTNSNQKLEIDYGYKRMRLDRILETSMTYPGNYGFVPNTLCDDGDALDILMPVDYTVPIGCVIKCKIIGVLIMEDEAGKDEKIIVMPANKVDPRFKDINDIKDLSPKVLEKIEHFFNHYKDLSPGKFVKTNGFKGAKEGVKYLEKSKKMFIKKLWTRKSTVSKRKTHTLSKRKTKTKTKSKSKSKSKSKKGGGPQNNKEIVPVALISNKYQFINNLKSLGVEDKINEINEDNVLKMTTFNKDKIIKGLAEKFKPYEDYYLYDLVFIKDSPENTISPQDVQLNNITYIYNHKQGKAPMTAGMHGLHVYIISTSGLDKNVVRDEIKNNRVEIFATVNNVIMQ